MNLLTSDENPTTPIGTLTLRHGPLSPVRCLLASGHVTGQGIWDFRAEARELMAAKYGKK
jgi:hypothetical protein